MAEIDQVLLTHGHLDHIGGLPEIKAASSAKVVIGKEDAFFLQDHRRAFDEFYGIETKLLSGKKDWNEAKRGFIVGAGPEYVPDRTIEDGAAIDLGTIELRAIALPGHSAGSLGYYWEEEGILIAGDSIPALGAPDGSIPIITDVARYIESVSRLQQMDLKTLVFTHDYRGLRLPPSKIRRNGEIAEYLRNAREMAMCLNECLQKQSAESAGRPFMEVVDAVIDEMPETMGFVRMARQLSPKFSAITVYCGLQAHSQRIG